MLTYIVVQPRLDDKVIYIKRQSILIYIVVQQ